MSSFVDLTEQSSPEIPPIHHPVQEMPNYDVLTLPELRNTVKRYGFKPTHRQDMIQCLEQVWKTHQSHQSTAPTPSPFIESVDSTEQALSDHIKDQTLSVTFEECYRGFNGKRKQAREFLDENALSYKSHTYFRP
ncbi:hypothetical protein BDF14DRAFT_1886171 [Spinellus fusiger]|nr:hypothetical protein BDF14DRAFT_1886171 [Spinellus fusiger]